MAPRRKKVQPEQPDEIDVFFAQYPEFTYCRDQPVHTEFYRMCDLFGWKQRDDPEREMAWKELRIAIIRAFNSVVGRDAEDLASWQWICHCLQIAPMPAGLRQAQQAVLDTHVNLVDLLACSRVGTPVQIFPTLEDLRAYTMDTGKYFPKEEAYAGGLLRFLLREILNKYEGYHGRRGKKGRSSRKKQKA